MNKNLVGIRYPTSEIFSVRGSQDFEILLGTTHADPCAGPCSSKSYFKNFITISFACYIGRYKVLFREL